MTENALQNTAQQPGDKPEHDVPKTGRMKRQEDVTFGHGRVVWNPRDLGWALPGGRLTRERDVALAVAMNIHDITQHANEEH